MASVKHVEIDGIFYYSIKKATEILNCDKRLIKQRCNSSDFQNYKFIVYDNTIEKVCSKCLNLKLINEFHFDRKSGRKNQHHGACKLCRRKYINNYWKDNSGLKKNKKLKMRYGISLDKYNIIFNKQNGCCAICKKHNLDLEKGLCVDHDHTNGEVRGLLCSLCNWGLGMFKDDVSYLKEAIDYLKDSNNE